MTAPAFSPEVVAGARAARAEYHRYSVVRDILRRFDVYDFFEAKVAFSAPTETACREWIDCQAFVAGLIAVRNQVLNHQFDQIVDRITSGSAQHE